MTEFLRTKFICIIWTCSTIGLEVCMFLRTKFICIIWTSSEELEMNNSSWGLSLFVLFELSLSIWGLNMVLED